MIQKILTITVMSFSFLGLFGQTNNLFKTTDVAEFEKAVADTAYVVLDVRTPAEHAEGYIPGTHLNIDVLEDDYTEIALRNLPKDKPVALYCRSGNRSKNAARILAEHGYQVLELGTGFRGWTAAGKEIEKPTERL
jgi:rhodanese-related sulfurtransferase